MIQLLRSCGIHYNWTFSIESKLLRSLFGEEIRQAITEGKLKPASGGTGGEANLIWLLDRRCAKGAQVPPEADRLRQRRTSYARGAQVQQL